MTDHGATLLSTTVKGSCFQDNSTIKINRLGIKDLILLLGFEEIFKIKFGYPKQQVPELLKGEDKQISGNLSQLIPNWPQMATFLNQQPKVR